MAIISSVAIFILLSYKSSISKAIKPFLLLVAAVLLLYFSVPKINARINLGWHEYTAPLSEVSNTSVGLRRQFWQASMIMIKDHPLIGIGRLQFAKEKSKLIDQGVLTSDADGYAHPHNEMLYAQVESGVFGLLGVLALYLGPLLYFIRALSNPDSQIQRAAVLGILIVVSYFVFGLVDVILVAWVMEAPVYIVSILIPTLIVNSGWITRLKKARTYKNTYRN
jgi:O-antigen ligase